MSSTAKMMPPNMSPFFPARISDLRPTLRPIAAIAIANKKLLTCLIMDNKGGGKGIKENTIEMTKKAIKYQGS